ncbi:hypothetical protein BSKO_02966 [Bryopsis sp. KO-2023]|nr:hypothetical protein BSKO_02966 [Bryopsis sp. KO-2023]
MPACLELDRCLLGSLPRSNMAFRGASASLLAAISKWSSRASKPLQPHTIWQRSRFTDPSGYEHFERSRRVLWDPKVNMYVFGAVGCCGLGLYISGLETVPYTHRRHSLMISAKKERQMGLETFQQVKASAAQDGTLLPNSHPIVKRIRQIGLRIAAVVDDGNGGGNTAHMKNLDWEFAVVDDRSNVNAFVVPGGKVVIFTGLLLSVISNDDELAAVLAHEAAHVVARHSAEKITELGVIVVLKVALNAIFGISFPIGLSQLIVSLPNSRRAETEADVIGARLMARACFNPSAAASVLNKLDKMEAKASKLPHDMIPDLLRTHPVTSERVKKVEQEIPEAIQVYHDSGCRMRNEFGEMSGFSRFGDSF